MNHHSPRPLLLMITLAVVLAGPGIGVKKNPPFLTISTAYSMTPLAALVVKPKVELTDKRVSLLDLCDQTDLPEDWKLLLSGVDITSTPEEGTEKYINPEQLRIFVQHLIESHGLDKESIKISIPERITILRKEIRLTAPQIEEIFRQFILSKVPWRAEDIVVHDISCPDAAVLPEGSVTHEIVPPPNERYLGNVTLPIRFYVNGKLARSIEVSGKVDLYQNLVYTRNPMKRNDVITENDIQMVRMNIADHPDRYATRIEDVVGKRLLSNIGFNKPICLRELDAPLAIKRGSGVTILYRYGGLTVTAKGMAKENGSEGARIKVTNVDSKQTVMCKVVDSRTVEVMSGIE